MPVPPGKPGMEQVLGEFKRGQLHSGSKTGPLVTKRKQAIAIAMKQSGQSRPSMLSKPPKSSIS